MKADVDAALKRVGVPLAESVAALHVMGVDRDTANEILRALLPLVNHALRLDARLSALERRMLSIGSQN